jgi:hypothetical protein
MTNNLDALLKAYIELTKQWEHVATGSNKERVWRSCKFLEQLIKKEINK